MKRRLFVLLAAIVGFGLLGCDAPTETKSAAKPKSSAAQNLRGQTTKDWKCLIHLKKFLSDLSPKNS